MRSRRVRCTRQRGPQSGRVTGRSWRRRRRAPHLTVDHDRRARDRLEAGLLGGVGHPATQPTVLVKPAGRPESSTDAQTLGPSSSQRPPSGMNPFPPRRADDDDLALLKADDRDVGHVKQVCTSAATTENKPFRLDPRATSVATRRSEACSATSRRTSSRACALEIAVAISSVKFASRSSAPSSGTAAVGLQPSRPTTCRQRRSVRRRRRGHPTIAAGRHDPRQALVGVDPRRLACLEDPGDHARSVESMMEPTGKWRSDAAAMTVAVPSARTSRASGPGGQAAVTFFRHQIEDGTWVGDARDERCHAPQRGLLVDEPFDVISRLRSHRRQTKPIG